MEVRMDLIEQKVTETEKILTAIGLPIAKSTKRKYERMALALLAVMRMKPGTAWDASLDDSLEKPITTREIITFLNTNYNQKISSGSYDDIRRKDLAPLIESRLVLKSGKSVINDPTRGYTLNPDSVSVIQKYGKPDWDKSVSTFIEKYGRLTDRLERPRDIKKIPAVFPDGQEISLDDSPHNAIQKGILEEFLPRFVPGAEIIYVGDASNKDLFNNSGRLRELGIDELSHGTLPDVIAFDSKHNWIFLIEAVHSSNPISKLRHLNLERLTEKSQYPVVYVSAFLDRQNLREWILDISWETEVWLAETPDHLIHFNGDKFLEPHQTK